MKQKKEKFHDRFCNLCHPEPCLPAGRRSRGTRNELSRGEEVIMCDGQPYARPPDLFLRSLLSSTRAGRCRASDPVCVHCPSVCLLQRKYRRWGLKCVSRCNRPIFLVLSLEVRNGELIRRARRPQHFALSCSVLRRLGCCALPLQCHSPDPCRLSPNQMSMVFLRSYG